MKDEILNCDKCECMKMYDYKYRIYYCNHDDRKDDMGKISVDNLPINSPEWCPRRKEVND